MKIPIKALLFLSLTCIASIVSRTHRRNPETITLKAEPMKVETVVVNVKEVKPHLDGGRDTCLPINTAENGKQNRYAGATKGTCASPCTNISCVQLKTQCCLYGIEMTTVVVKNVNVEQKHAEDGGSNTCLPPRGGEKFTERKSGACPTPCTGSRCQVRGTHCCFYDAAAKKQRRRKY